MGGGASTGLAGARRAAERAAGGDPLNGGSPAQARRYIRAMARAGYTVTERRVLRLARGR